MDRNDFGCLLKGILHLVAIIVFIGSGVIAWVFVSPHRLFENILFLILWIALNKILQCVTHFLIIGVASMFDTRL